MPNYTEPVVFNCPNCGSSISIQGDQGACAYCGTPVERPFKTARVNSNSPSWPVAASSYPTGAPSKPRRRGAPPLLTLLLVALAATGGFFTGRLGPASTNTTVAPTTSAPAAGVTAAPIAATDNGSIAQLSAALPRDGKGSELLVYLYHSESNRYSLGLIDGGTHTARWQSPLLGKNASQGLLALGQELVYITDADQLLALRLRDGTLAWQAALAVEPSPGCYECLRLVGGQVAVLEKDGSLQVFEGQTGKPAWSTRLENRPNRLAIAGDRVMTMAPSANKKGQLISFLAASSGEAALQLAPVCPPDPEMGRDERPDASTPFLFSADGKTMYTIFGFFAQCAQAWDLVAGKTIWQTPVDRAMSPAIWYNSPPVLTDKALFASNGGLLWAIDTANGQTRTLVTDKEYNFTPLALQNDTLITLAAPTWDLQRQELWGLDSATGKRRWQIKLKAHDLREEHSSGDWMWRLTPKGLVVIQALNDEPKLITETFDPASGASLQRAELPLPNDYSSVTEALWGDDTVYVEISGKVYAIDLATGRLEYQLT